MDVGQFGKIILETDSKKSFQPKKITIFIFDELLIFDWELFFESVYISDIYNFVFALPTSLSKKYRVL